MGEKVKRTESVCSTFSNFQSRRWLSFPHSLAKPLEASRKISTEESIKVEKGRNGQHQVSFFQTAQRGRTAAQCKRRFAPCGDKCGGRSVQCEGAVAKCERTVDKC